MFEKILFTTWGIFLRQEDNTVICCPTANHITNRKLSFTYSGTWSTNGTLETSWSRRTLNMDKEHTSAYKSRTGESGCEREDDV